ncbi:MAG: FAD-dependent oxidoreductase [Planctomycetes bacterium]|nr:FAD-dependent oxidoreductase [Planctomycetota bacterium]
MKIAVVGAGISGLTAAYRLGTDHEVTLLEAADYLGGHTHTVDVELASERHAIDTGFIVFNDWTYPNFIALLEELEIESRPTSMGFSVTCERTGLEYSGSTLNGLFAQRSNLLRPRFYRMIRDILRFNREAPQILSAPATESAREQTVGEFLEAGRYSREFAEHYLVPMGSAIWSCPLGVFREFPIRFIVEFYRNHGLLSVNHRPTWRVVAGGSRTYVDALLRRFRGQVRTNAPVTRVTRQDEGVEITVRGHEPERFDHVVLACHADQALRMLADPSPVERELLSAFPYERNVAILHTDTTLLPARRRAWESWNYRISPEPEAGATVTYCMNILQHLQSAHVFSVSLNSEERIAPEKVLGRFVYEHPVFTTRRTAAQARHRELINQQRTSFCGAYWRNGFHEDGVVSALAVCKMLQPASAAVELATGV